MNPLISVIIPTYQAGATLENALKTIVGQSFQNYEILIMDGGSKDETARIAEEYSAQWSNLKFFTAPDKGIYDAMNKGILAARGDWVLFLGSDDALYDKETLSSVSKKLTNENDVIYGDVFSTRFGGRYDGEFSEEKIFTKNICHQAIFFRRTIFDSIGNFDIKYRFHADWEHNMRWFLSGKVRKAYIPVTVANYADGGLSSSGDPVFSEYRKLLYVKYGRQQLKFRRKAAIILDEVRRAVGSRSPALLLRALSACLYLL